MITYGTTFARLWAKLGEPSSRQAGRAGNRYLWACGCFAIEIEHQGYAVQWCDAHETLATPA